MNNYEVEKQIKQLEEQINIASAAYHAAKVNHDTFLSELANMSRSELIEIAKTYNVRIHEKMPSKNNKKEDLYNAIAETIVNRYNETKEEYDRLLQQLSQLQEALVSEENAPEQIESEPEQESDSVEQQIEESEPERELEARDENEQASQSEQSEASEQDRLEETTSEYSINILQIEEITRLVARPLPEPYKIYHLSDGTFEIHDQFQYLETRESRAAAMKFIGQHAGQVQLPGYLQLRYDAGRWYLYQKTVEGDFEPVRTEHKHHMYATGGYVSHTKLGRAQDAALRYIKKLNEQENV